MVVVYGSGWSVVVLCVRTQRLETIGIGEMPLDAKANYYFRHDSANGGSNTVYRGARVSGEAVGQLFENDFDYYYFFFFSRSSELNPPIRTIKRVVDNYITLINRFFTPCFKYRFLIWFLANLSRTRNIICLSSINSLNCVFFLFTLFLNKNAVDFAKTFYKIIILCQ